MCCLSYHAHLPPPPPAQAVANIKQQLCTAIGRFNRFYSPRRPLGSVEVYSPTLFLNLGTRRGWGVSVTPRPHSTPGKDPVSIVQETVWAPGLVWTDAENLGFDPRTVQPVTSPYNCQLNCISNPTAEQWRNHGGGGAGCRDSTSPPPNQNLKKT
jgi:hypothetical protein